MYVKSSFNIFNFFLPKILSLMESLKYNLIDDLMKINTILKLTIILRLNTIH